MQEAGVQSLGQEDPLEKEVATHSSIPAWEIPWTEELGPKMGHNWSDLAPMHPVCNTMLMNSGFGSR